MEDTGKLQIKAKLIEVFTLSLLQDITKILKQLLRALFVLLVVLFIPMITSMHFLKLQLSSPFFLMLKFFNLFTGQC